MCSWAEVPGNVPVGTASYQRKSERVQASPASLIPRQAGLRSALLAVIWAAWIGRIIVCI